MLAVQLFGTPLMRLTCRCRIAGTPMDGLKTPAAEVAQTLLVVMRRGRPKRSPDTNMRRLASGACRAATHAAALTQVLASDLHLSQVEIAEFWSFVQKKRGQRVNLMRENAGAAWSKTATVVS